MESQPQNPEFRNNPENFHPCIKSHIVNSEIFARVLFLRNFTYAKFRENKTLVKWLNHSVVY